MPKNTFLSPYIKPFIANADLLFIIDLFGRKFHIDKSRMSKTDKVFYEAVQSGELFPLFGFLVYDPMSIERFTTLMTLAVECLESRGILGFYHCENLYFCVYKGKPKLSLQNKIYNRLYERYNMTLEAEMLRFVYAPVYDGIPDETIGY